MPTPSPFPYLIGFHSPAPGCGKTTVAKFLVKKHGYHRVPFAEPLRAMATTLLLSFGYSPEKAVEVLNDPLGKDILIQQLGVTPRQLLQTLGTEWGRLMIHPRIWLNAWDQTVKNLPLHTNVVVDDVRFPNEAALIQGFSNSTLWWIDRPCITASPEVIAHASQQPLDRDAFSRTLNNCSSKEELFAQVNNILEVKS